MSKTIHLCYLFFLHSGMKIDTITDSTSKTLPLIQLDTNTHTHTLFITFARSNQTFVTGHANKTIKSKTKISHKKRNFQIKSTLSAGAGLLDYITFFLLSLFYAVKSFIVIPVHCWVATSMWQLVCQVDLL